ncbi:MFS transporter, partial [Nocardia asteroides]
MTLTDLPSETRPRPAAPAVRPAAALALLVAAHFLLNLDSAIVEVALPSVKRELGTTLAELSWIANAYILAFGGFLLLGGRLGDMLGRRSVFTAALVVFAAASLAGGLATSAPVLVAARAVQG